MTAGRWALTIAVCLFLIAIFGLMAYGAWRGRPADDTMTLGRLVLMMAGGVGAFVAIFIGLILVDAPKWSIFPAMVVWMVLVLPAVSRASRPRR